MNKFYKVIKDNFLWEEGAILKQTQNGTGYEPVDDLYKKHEGNEYITSVIVENSPETFVRVYPVNLVTRTVYKLKEEAKAIMSKSMTE